MGSMDHPREFCNLMALPLSKADKDRVVGVQYTYEEGRAPEVRLRLRLSDGKTMLQFEPRTFLYDLSKNAWNESKLESAQEAAERGFRSS
jgi:hypothetical protein